MEVFLGLGLYGNNVYCLKDDEQKIAIIIDAAQGSFERLQPLLQGYRVHLILTHGHWDHLMDAAKFQKELNAIVYLHRDDAVWLNLKLQQKIQPRSIHFESLGKPDIWLDGREHLYMGPWEIDILHLSGHTAGSIGVYFPEEEILFSGDTLFASAIGRFDFPGGSRAKLLQSLLLLSQLPSDIKVYPGHGEATTIEQEQRIIINKVYHGLR